ncbi:hypothetical protein [Streptomyces sp. B21-083]|uniref:hypothetical protein n=1 Tax=Streptomyces sp. B21-083 TaxID=3039410 RepID=UPI002FEE8F52
MTTPSSRSPRPLLIATLVLAVAGTVLLILPARNNTASATPSPAAASAVRPSSPSTGEDSAAGGPGPSKTTVAAPSASATARALPPHGEGVAGDRAIQQALEAAWPADLPTGTERQLLTGGRELLRADATGIGRDKWPSMFGNPDQAIAPAFATARFRIQAVIAHRNAAGDQAVVHLVWAGTDRGGTFTDGRITDLHFTRTTSKKDGGATWTPQPHT